MSFSPEDFRQAVSQFATGVVVVTGNGSGSLIGFAAQSFVSLSLDPPLVLFCPQKSSTSWPRIRALANFGVNVLGAERADTSEEFAVVGSVPKVEWKPAPSSGVPILEESIAFIDCTLKAEYEAGDHTIVVSNVADVQVRRPDSDPLLYLRGAYGKFLHTKTPIRE